MIDDIQHLRDTPLLCRLLTHYCEQSRPDRQAWQDRLMRLDELDPAPLSRLHGELIALGWLEQNTGITPAVKAGQVPGCYRATSAGQRALKQLAGDDD